MFNSSNYHYSILLYSIDFNFIYSTTFLERVNQLQPIVIRSKTFLILLS